MKKKPPHQKKLEKYIGDEYIAHEISKSKRPYLYAAMAKVESDYRPRIVGDEGKSFGLFQIQQRYHGAFDDRVECQVNKVQSILEPLIAKHGFEGGIRRYNGRGKKARVYAMRVLRIEKEIRNI